MFIPQYGQRQIIRVNGEAGARAFQMMPNESILLLDENDPVVWLAQTDMTGAKNVVPYSISAYKKPETEIEKRLRRLEELYESNHQCAAAQE